MLKASIISVTNYLIVQAVSLKDELVMFRWTRQTTTQLTVLLVALLYSCAVLEIDLGDTGDRFGDVYDTYVPSTPVQSPKPTVAVYREILPATPVVAFNKGVPASSVNWGIILALPPLAFYVYSHSKRRRLHVLHAIWRL